MASELYPSVIENWRFSGEGFIQTLLIYVRHTYPVQPQSHHWQLCIAKLQHYFELSKLKLVFFHTLQSIISQIEKTQISQSIIIEEYKRM